MQSKLKATQTMQVQNNVSPTRFTEHAHKGHTTRSSTGITVFHTFHKGFTCKMPRPLLWTSMVSEGESWSLMGWSQDRFRALLADQTFNMSIDTINLAQVGLHAVGAYEGLACSKGEAFRAAPDTYGPPQFRLCGTVGYKSIQPKQML